MSIVYVLEKKSSLVTCAFSAKSCTRDTDSLHSCTRLRLVQEMACLYHECKILPRKHSYPNLIPIIVICCVSQQNSQAMEFLEGHWGARGKLRGANCEGRSARGKLRGANCESERRGRKVRGEGREVSGNSEVRKADIDCPAPARYLRYVWRTIASQSDGMFMML